MVQVSLRRLSKSSFSWLSKYAWCLFLDWFVASSTEPLRQNKSGWKSSKSKVVSFFGNVSNKWEEREHFLKGGREWVTKEKENSESTQLHLELPASACTWSQIVHGWCSLNPASGFSRSGSTWGNRPLPRMEDTLIRSHSNSHWGEREILDNAAETNKLHESIVNNTVSFEQRKRSRHYNLNTPLVL